MPTRIVFCGIVLVGLLLVLCGARLAFALDDPESVVDPNGEVVQGPPGGGSPAPATPILDSSGTLVIGLDARHGYDESHNFAIRGRLKGRYNER